MNRLWSLLFYFLSAFHLFLAIRCLTASALILHSDVLMNVFALLNITACVVFAFIGSIVLMGKDDDLDYEDGQLDLDAGFKTYMSGGKK